MYVTKYIMLVERPRYLLCHVNWLLTASRATLVLNITIALCCVNWVIKLELVLSPRVRMYKDN